MYWPITTARRLHLSPSGLHTEQKVEIISSEDSRREESGPEQRIKQIERSLRGHLWATLTADTISIWSVRPAQILTALVRTPKSVEEYGSNVSLRWRTDGRGVVIEVSFMLVSTCRF